MAKTKKPEQNSAEIGFEKQLWDAVNILRGNIDASEYKRVILGLIFLKYLSDKFEDQYKTLKEAGDGFEEDRDARTECILCFGVRSVGKNSRQSSCPRNRKSH